jgi:hypothetical protein
LSHLDVFGGMKRIRIPKRISIARITSSPPHPLPLSPPPLRVLRALRVEPLRCVSVVALLPGVGRVPRGVCVAGRAARATMIDVEAATMFVQAATMFFETATICISKETPVV